MAISEDYLSEYGSNYFLLKYYFNNKVRTMNGVLKELPSMGQSTKWESGPRTAITDFLMKYCNSDTMQLLTLIAGSESNLVTTDDNTSRVYTGTDTTGLTLNFRVYRYQNMGSKKLTTADEWINNLLYATQPNINNNFSIENVKQQYVQAFDSLVNENGKGYADNVNKITSEISNIFKKDKTVNINNIKDGLQGLENQVITPYNEDIDPSGKITKRVKESPKKGACLFELHLYSWIFKKPLVVLIDSWNYSNSVEVDTNGKSLYTDFSISCKLDQKQHSAVYWNDMITGNNNLSIHYSTEQNSSSDFQGYNNSKNNFKKLCDKDLITNTILTLEWIDNVNETFSNNLKNNYTIDEDGNIRINDNLVYETKFEPAKTKKGKSANIDGYNSEDYNKSSKAKVSYIGMKNLVSNGGINDVSITYVNGFGFDDVIKMLAARKIIDEFPSKLQNEIRNCYESVTISNGSRAKEEGKEEYSKTINVLKSGLIKSIIDQLDQIKAELPD